MVDRILVVSILFKKTLHRNHKVVMILCFLLQCFVHYLHLNLVLPVLHLFFFKLGIVGLKRYSIYRILKNHLIFQGALFESNHYDENDVQTISHRCDVLSLDKFKIGSANQKQGLAAAAADPEEDSNDKYYLAGSHNAVEKTVQFSPGVLL